MKNPWWPFYGDEFTLDTQHVGPLEVGIYVILLNEYYRTGKPLPDSYVYLSRICKIGNLHPEDPQDLTEIKTLDLVLKEFFQHDEPSGVYRHKRVDLELVERSKRYQQKIAASEAGLAARKHKTTGRYTERSTDRFTERLTERSTHIQIQEQIQNHKSKAKAQAPFFPEWLPVEAWESYEEMRQKMRKPMTDKARELAISALDKLRMEGQDPKSVLEQSVMHGWQGLFPLKELVHVGQTPGTSKAQERVSRNRKAILEGLGYSPNVGLGSPDPSPGSYHSGSKVLVGRVQERKPGESRVGISGAVEDGEILP